MEHKVRYEDKYVDRDSFMEKYIKNDWASKEKCIFISYEMSINFIGL